LQAPAAGLAGRPSGPVRLASDLPRRLVSAPAASAGYAALRAPWARPWWWL